MQLRCQNLNNLFGFETFETIEFLDIGADKDKALSKYEGSGYYWIEDKAKNAEAGLQFGLKPILIDHLHNQDYHHPAIPRVQNWAEIADIILSNE